MLRALARKRVVFYCHFPDKLLANGAFTESNLNKKNVPLLKRIYRYPMDWLEEATTSAYFIAILGNLNLNMATAQADIILANSKFSARVTKSNFVSLRETPRVIYPGINIAAYEQPTDLTDPDIMQISSYVICI
jgi:alpha-1,3/alpha-1,6-mannosyltransferase